MSENLRILIADDDNIFREGMANLLNHEEGITVCATAANGLDALMSLATTPVDVAVLDVDMPVLDGIEAARTIAEKFPTVAVVMLTAFEHQESLAKSIAANVKGFLTKDISPDQLALLLKQAAAGLPIMTQEPMRLLADTYIKSQVNVQEYGDFISSVEALPDYLRSVFDLVIKARSNKQISKELYLAESTVRSYVTEILKATGFSTRGQLTVTAIKAGF